MKNRLKFFYILDSAVVLLLFIFAAVTYREWTDIDAAREKAETSSFVKLSNGYTEYEIAGPTDGPPVVLIHGLTVDIYDWDFQFGFLADQGFRVLRYAQYGRGLSDRPDAVYDRNLYLNQLDEIIDRFFDRPVNLVGHSFGGALAAEYKSRFDEKVDRVVLISPAVNLIEHVGGVRLIRIPLIGDYFAMTILSPIILSRSAILFETAEQDVTNEYTKLFDRQTRIKGFARSIKSQFRSDAVEDFYESYSDMDGTATLLLWGDQDNTIPEEHIDLIGQMNSEISIIKFKGINHHPNMEIPAIVNGQILGFFQSSLDREGT